MRTRMVGSPGGAQSCPLLVESVESLNKARRDRSETGEISTEALLNLTTLRRRWPGLYDGKAIVRAWIAGQLVFEKIRRLVEKRPGLRPGGRPGSSGPRKGRA